LSNLETLARSNPDDVSIQAEFAVTLNNIGDRHSRAGESGLALASHRRALAVLEPLAAAAPDVAPLQIERARCENAIGRQLLVSGQSAQALASFDRARATYDSQMKADASARDATRGLAASYAGLGRCRVLAGKPVDAAEAFSRAVYVLEKARGLASEDLAELAAFHSLLASVAGHAESRLIAAPGQAEAETALATLRQAVSMGYRDFARLRSDTDFDSLRVRPDFQLILMDLAMPEDPFVHGR
jgi:tetratricopeptide (TPR) repeat protein